MSCYPQCLTCKHFIKGTLDGKIICKAFPYGVPEEYIKSSGDYKIDREFTSKDHVVRKVHSIIDPRQVGGYVFI